MELAYFIFLVEIVFVVVAEVQLVLNTNAPSIGCFARTEQANCDIIGPEDPDFGISDNRILANFATLTYTSSWRKYSSIDSASSSDNWHKLPFHTTLNNHTHGITLHDSLIVYVYGSQAIIMYERNRRIVFESNSITAEKRHESTSDWSEDESTFAPYDSKTQDLFVPNQWNRINITNAEKSVCFYVGPYDRFLFCSTHKSEVVKFATTKDELTYWKIDVRIADEFFYWETHKEIRDIVPLPIPIVPIYKSFCLSLTVNMCLGCRMNIGLADENADVVTSDVVHGDTNWRTVKLVIEDVTEGNYSLVIGTDGRRAKTEDHFWSVRSIESCDPVVRVRKNLSDVRKAKDYKCIAPTNISVHLTEPRPHKMLLHDFEIMANNLRVTEPFNVICIGRGNVSECYCNKGYEGPQCTADGNRLTKSNLQIEQSDENRLIVIQFDIIDYKSIAMKGIAISGSLAVVILIGYKLHLRQIAKLRISEDAMRSFYA